jgi:polysaccharide export outer membrane protein
VVVVSRFVLLAAVLVLSGSAVVPDRLSAQAVSASGAGLRPGDQVRLKIWREPDLSGDFAVDESGTVVLPKLGAVRLDTIPADSLRSRLTDAYRTFLNNPSVEVTPLRRVAVIGAVVKPGLYPADPTMTVSDVLALAGGASPNGKPDRVEVRREGRQVDVALAPGSTMAGALIRSGDQLYVPQRGWLSRNSWLLSTIIGAGATITTILLSR